MARHGFALHSALHSKCKQTRLKMDFSVNRDLKLKMTPNDKNDYINDKNDKNDKKWQNDQNDKVNPNDTNDRKWQKMAKITR